MANLVTKGYVTADIGTDHAYIPIYLVRNNLVPKAFAVDVREGPLSCAAQNVALEGLEEKITVLRSDGFSALLPGQVQAVQSAVLSGMGGPLMIRLLREGAAAVKSFRECILQPQSQAAMVRSFLLEEGFSLVKEDMVFEDGKFYPMMKVRPPASGKPPSEPFCLERQGEIWTEVEIRYGKYLLTHGHPVLKQLLEKEEAQKSSIIERLKKSGSDRAGDRIRELSGELDFIRKGLNYYAL